MGKMDFRIFPLLLLLVLMTRCREDRKATNAGEWHGNETSDGPEWAQNDNNYEVNIRQYTPEGTLAAFEKHLPRIRKMGVDILCFMPVFPISERKRKGSEGNYYAVSDFRAIHPDYGTLEEFKALVHRIHDMNMRVLLDWVPRYTGWDHSWISEHPEWYTKDEEGHITYPGNSATDNASGWTDVADLNYDAPGLRKAMIAEMAFWLESVGVDGFRCASAAEVPLDFWEECIPELRSIKPGLFMLAEAELPSHRKEDLFTISSGWSFHYLLDKLARGEARPQDIDQWLEEDRAAFKRGYHMHFITNHDVNCWKGTIEERMGNASDAMAVLAFTFDGMPLIHNGQEAGLNKRLRFYEKDQIDWGSFQRQDFYRTLLDLKHHNRALWNGIAGGEPVRIPTDNDDWIYAFYRQKGEDKVVVVVNLSPDYLDVTLKSDACKGDYVNVFANSTITISKNMMLQLNPWDYVVWSNR